MLIYHICVSMPINYHIDYVEGRAEMVASGRVTGAELITKLEMIFSDEHWSYEMPQLWDSSHVDELDIDFSELVAVRSLVESLQEYREKWGRIAVVVGNRTTYMIIRAILAMSVHKRSRIFNDRKSAIVWLQLPPSESFPSLVDDQ